MIARAQPADPTSDAARSVRDDAHDGRGALAAVERALARVVEALRGRAREGGDVPVSSAGTTPARGILVEAVASLVGARSAKRVRPRLVIAFGDLAGVNLDDSRLVDAACAVELIHSASLLHDDVVDEAGERRGIPTANARYGNHAAVLAGDHVLAGALRRLAFDARAMHAAVDAVLAMSAAAVCEIEVRGRLDVDERLLTSVAVGKTGALFGLCGRLAGILAGDDALARTFEQVGVDLGLAFQLADDAADLADDFAARAPSIPLVRALALDPTLAGDALLAVGEEEGARAVAVHVDAVVRGLARFRGARAYDEIATFASALAHRACPR